MKQILVLIPLLVIFLASSCTPTYKRQPAQSGRKFFTPRNWQIPIEKEGQPSSPSAAPTQPKSKPVIVLPDEEDEPKNPEEQMIGFASWYGPGFHGEKTANGEQYDQDALTAAHRFLPMNTWVQVTNLENNKTVIVRINDRGPYKKNRIIDLTRRAAESLEFKEQGTARVSLKIIRYPKDYDPTEGMTPYKQMIVQIGVFSTRQRADAFKMQLNQKYAKIPIFVETRKELFYVLAGPYEEKKDADRVSSALKREGIDNFVRSYKK